MKNTSLYEEFKKAGHVQGGFERLQRIDKNYRMFKKQKGIKDYTDLITEFNKTNWIPKHIGYMHIKDSKIIQLGEGND